jgi:hypothetical protein
MRINYVESEFHKTPWLHRTTFDILIKSAIPRPHNLPPTDERPRTPWTLQVSIFHEYKSETPELLMDCFEFDWATMKKPKFRKSEEEEVKEACRELYPSIQMLYRRLSATGSGSVFAIGSNVLRDLLSHSMHFVEQKTLKPEDIDRLFIQVNSNGQRKTSYNP